MRKVILMVQLAVASSGAMAEWVKVGSDQTMTVYANPATIRKADNMVKMWNLFDLNTPQTDAGYTYLSEKKQNEYNCKKEQSRILTLSWHSKNMGEGKVVYSGLKHGEWYAVPPGSATEILWKFACEKLR